MVGRTKGKGKTTKGNSIPRYGIMISLLSTSLAGASRRGGRKYVPCHGMEGASSMNRDPHRIQVVVRACEVLKAFQHDGEALVLSDVVTRTGLSKTTVFRLLQSLVAGGLVQRVGARAYRCQVRPLLSRPFRLGFAAQQDSEFSSEVTRSLQHAAARARVEMIIVNNRYSAREAFR